MHTVHAAAAESVFVLSVLKKSPPGESRKSFGRDKVPGGGARNIVSRDGPQDKPAGAIKFDREGPQ